MKQFSSGWLLRRCLFWTGKRLFLVSLSWTLAASLSPSEAQETSRVQVQGIRGQFMVDLALDLSGQAWIATEEQGLWRQDVSATGEERWKQFTTREGLGDDHVYAVACDRQGRIWAGHLNRGVCRLKSQRSLQVLASGLVPFQRRFSRANSHIAFGLLPFMRRFSAASTCVGSRAC